MGKSTSTGVALSTLTKRNKRIATASEKMLTYALGRGVEYYDMPAIREIVSQAAEGDFRFSAIVLGIVESTPFQMRMSQ